MGKGEFQLNKIVYIHQYYKTPKEGGSLRSYYLSKELAKAGYEVHMITSHNKTDSISETIEGVYIHYLPVRYENEMSFYRRINAFLVFSFKSLILTTKLKPTFIYATSTPLTIGLVPLVMSIFKATPYVFEVRDLWPNAPIEMGYIRNKILIRLTKWLEKAIYKNARGIVALSEGMQKHIQKMDNKTPNICIPNMADTKYFKPNNWLQIKEKQVLTISYIGSAGPANELTNLIKFANYLQLNNHINIEIVIAASGKDLHFVKNICTKSKLKNVHFRKYLDKEGVKKVLANTDFTYLTFKDIPSLRVASPNKLFDSLAAGIPVISAIQGWWVKDLKAQQCGLDYNPNNPAELYKALIPFIHNPELLIQYKKNAYYLAHTKYSKEELSKQYLSFIKDVIEP